MEGEKFRPMEQKVAFDSRYLIVPIILFVIFLGKSKCTHSSASLVHFFFSMCYMYVVMSARVTT